MATFAICDSSNVVQQIVEASEAALVTALELGTIYGGSGYQIIEYSGKRCGIGLKYNSGTDEFDDI